MDVLEAAILAFIFCFGVALGSFLNVALYRFGSGAGIGGRSKCLSCGKTLTARMLIPLFSFIFQRGRCAYCGAKLSVQYPLVELALGILFLVVAKKWNITVFPVDMEHLVITALDLISFTALLFITVYDLRHKIIPDRFAALFAASALAALLLRWHWGLLPVLYNVYVGAPIPFWLDLLAGPILAAPVALLWYFSGGRAMGLGDAKLLVGAGWFLGFAQGITALVFGFWIAFIPSILLLCIPSKRFTMKSEIPFGPFIVLGVLVVYVFGINILQWAL